MAKKQSRRSISVSGELYTALRAHCEKHGVSMSGVVEKLCRQYFDIPARNNGQRKPIGNVQTL